MVNSCLGTCNQLHHPRICMQFFIQATLTHEATNDITIVRYMVNQIKKNLITNITLHLDNRCLMINLLTIQCSINIKNIFSNISNYLFLLRTINLRSVTLLLWKIPPVMILATSPTLQRLPSITLVMLLILKSLFFISYIEFL